MRELGAPEVPLMRLLRDLRSADATRRAYYREQLRIILEHNYPKEAKVDGRACRSTTVSLRTRYPQVYDKRTNMMRRMKDRLTEGRITLEQYYTFEVDIKAWMRTAYEALVRGEPMPDTPPYPTMMRA